MNWNSRGKLLALADAPIETFETEALPHLGALYRMARQLVGTQGADDFVQERSCGRGNTLTRLSRRPIVGRGSSAF